MNKLSMCQMCKDPIWSYICPNCLANAIEDWLPYYLKGEFREFSENFFKSFSSTTDMDGLRCLRCHKVRLSTICPFCFIAEAYDFLRERDLELAQTLLKSIPVQGDWKFDSMEEKTWKGAIVPVTNTEIPTTEVGSCEMCDSFSNRLTNYEGRWICRECESFER